MKLPRRNFLHLVARQIGPWHFLRVLPDEAVLGSMVLVPDRKTNRPWIVGEADHLSPSTCDWRDDFRRSCRPLQPNTNHLI